VAGSRREYLAADKRTIYSAVKLSSATDAYSGPDLGGRPQFKVAILYEDSAVGKRATHFYNRVIRELVDECDFSLELWNFEVLAVPEIGSAAAKAAAQADFVILSMHEHVHRPGNRRVLRRYARPGKQNGKPELPIHRIAQCGESRGFIETNIHKRGRGRRGVTRRLERPFIEVSKSESPAEPFPDGVKVRP
jgi:hypothetical protein